MPLLIAPRKKSNANLCQKMLFRYKTPAKPIGVVANTKVFYMELPWDMAEIQCLSDKKLARIIKSINKFITKYDCKIIGMPHMLREFYLSQNMLQLFKVSVADGKKLWIESVKAQLEVYIGNLENQEITVWGIEEIWHKQMVDELIGSKAKPILVGGRAKSLSEYYFQKSGIAVPVLKGQKAVKAKAIVYLPSSDGNKKVDEVLQKSPKVFILEETNLQVVGNFKEPFAFGFFPAGMAAALKLAGYKVLYD